MTSVTDTFAFGSTLGQRFAKLRSHYAASAAQRKVYRDTLRELEGLTDRDLADLGMHRANIKSVAYQAAYGN